MQMMSMKLIDIDAKLKNENAINAKGWFDWKQWNIIKHKNLLTRIKMGKKILTFQDLEIEKKKFFTSISLLCVGKGCRYCESVSI